MALLGNYGFAMREPIEIGVPILDAFKELTETNPKVLQPLRGRRVFTTSNHETVEGSEGTKRAYTLVIDSDGTPLHLNRFFTNAWVPPETRGVRELMESVEPALTFDCHETSRQGDRYHVSLRPQQTEEGDQRELQIAEAITDAVTEQGISLALKEEVMDEPTKTVGHREDQPAASFYSHASEGPTRSIRTRHHRPDSARD